MCNHLDPERRGSSSAGKFRTSNTRESQISENATYEAATHPSHSSTCNTHLSSELELKHNHHKGLVLRNTPSFQNIHTSAPMFCSHEHFCCNEGIRTTTSPDIIESVYNRGVFLRTTLGDTCIPTWESIGSQEIETSARGLENEMKVHSNAEVETNVTKNHVDRNGFSLESSQQSFKEADGNRDSFFVPIQRVCGNPICRRKWKQLKRVLIPFFCPSCSAKYRRLLSRYHKGETSVDFHTHSSSSSVRSNLSEKDETRTSSIVQHFIQKSEKPTGGDQCNFHFNKQIPIDRREGNIHEYNEVGKRDEIVNGSKEMGFPTLLGSHPSCFVPREKSRNNKIQKEKFCSPGLNAPVIFSDSHHGNFLENIDEFKNYDVTENKNGYLECLAEWDSIYADLAHYYGITETSDESTRIRSNSSYICSQQGDLYSEYTDQKVVTGEVGFLREVDPSTVRNWPSNWCHRSLIEGRVIGRCRYMSRVVRVRSVSLPFEEHLVIDWDSVFSIGSTVRYIRIVNPSVTERHVIPHIIKVLQNDSIIKASESVHDNQ